MISNIPPSLIKFSFWKEEQKIRLHWIKTFLETLCHSLWRSSCMTHNDCHHSLLIPLWLAYFWLLFSNSLILMWTTCLALELIKLSATVLSALKELWHTVLYNSEYHFPPVSAFKFVPILVSVITSQHFAPSFKKNSDLVFHPLILLFFFFSLPPRTQMNNKWSIIGIALSDDQLRFVSKMPQI